VSLRIAVWEVMAIDRMGAYDKLHL
jgi:hypothetical protein